MFEAIAIAGIVSAIGGAIGGYVLATHIHSVAAAAASAVTRATTVHVAPPVDKAVAGVGADVNKVIENATRQTL